MNSLECATLFIIIIIVIFWGLASTNELHEESNAQQCGREHIYYFVNYFTIRSIILFWDCAHECKRALYILLVVLGHFAGRKRGVRNDSRTRVFINSSSKDVTSCRGIRWSDSIYSG